MKLAAIILAAAALAGCATLPGSEPPRYDRAQQAMIAPGYPIERASIPSGFEFADIYEESRRQEHDPAIDQGSANVKELGVSWAKSTGKTAVATMLHQGLSQGSLWQPWRGADGYEFRGSRKFQYLMQTGRYSEVSGDAGSIPSAAPECAVNAVMITYSRDRRKRTVLTYTEGRNCDRIALFSQRDAEEIRQRAYRVFGLR